MSLLDRYGNPVPGSPKHRRAVGFTATTVPLKDDEETINGITPPKEYNPDVKRDEHDPFTARRPK